MRARRWREPVGASGSHLKSTILMSPWPCQSILGNLLEKEETHTSNHLDTEALLLETKPGQGSHTWCSLEAGRPIGLEASLAWKRPQERGHSWNKGQIQAGASHARG